MTHKGVRCVFNPDMLASDPLSTIWASPERLEYVAGNRAYQLQVALTSRCNASCGYCYASASEHGELTLPKERVLRLIDEAKELDMKVFGLDGGEALLHPHWYDLACYALEKGMKCEILTSGLISKKDAKRLVSLGEGMELVSVHLDTINQEVYNKVHTNPSTLEKRIQGYHNLLEAGYPSEQIIACITYTKPVSESIEETVDWYVDEMGARFVAFISFKAEGYAKRHLDWEPSLSEVRKACEYRAKKLGQHWLKIGSSDGSKFICKSHVAINYDGRVMPCQILYDLSAGNIFEEPLKTIYERSRDELNFNYPIEGPCGSCVNSDVCFGCRAAAYTYLGNVRASDPKCFLNPEAKEYYYR